MIFVYFHMEQLNRGRDNLVTNDICLFSYGAIKPRERIQLQMISVYFHMAKLNRGRENLVTNDICLFSYGAIKPRKRIWLQMIFVYFHMAKLNRRREFVYPLVSIFIYKIRKYLAFKVLSTDIYRNVFFIFQRYLQKRAFV